MSADQDPSIDDLINALPLNEKVPVVALRALLNQRQELDDEQERQIQDVRLRFYEDIKPILARISELIQGKDPKSEQTAKIAQYLKPGEKMPQLKGKIIDSYWNAALQNSSISGFITEKDEKALQSLLDIQIAQSGNNPQGINLRFIFKPNSYFTQTNIVRRLRIIDGNLVGLEGDLLSWKPGNWLTHQCKRVKNKTTGETSVIQGKKLESFFSIFQNCSIDNLEELSRAEKIMRKLTQVIHDSLRCFLGMEDESASESQPDEYEQDDDEEIQEPKPTKKQK